MTHAQLFLTAGSCEKAVICDVMVLGVGESRGAG